MNKINIFYDKVWLIEINNEVYNLDYFIDTIDITRKYIGNLNLYNIKLKGIRIPLINQLNMEMQNKIDDIIDIEIETLKDERDKKDNM